MTTIGDKVYPNTESYVIAFEAGACGNFLKTLLFQFLYGHLPYNISDFGKSHNTYNFYKNQTELYRLVKLSSEINNYDHSKPAPDVENLIPYQYLLHDPQDETKPFVTVEHIVPNFDLLFNKFPKAKCIIITVDEEMSPRVGGNIFFKTIMDEYETNKWYKTRWIQYQQEHPELKKYNHPRELSSLEIQIASAKYIAKIPEVKIPKKYSHNIFILTLKELLYDKYKVLDLLKTVTGKSYNKFHLKYYDQYLEKQKELVDKHMPWITK